MWATKRMHGLNGTRLADTARADQAQKAHSAQCNAVQRRTMLVPAGLLQRTDGNLRRDEWQQRCA